MAKNLRINKTTQLQQLNIADVTDLQSTLTELTNNLSEHVKDKDNPHVVTTTQLGLDKVDNTADKDKPISTATQLALDELNVKIIEDNLKSFKDEYKILVETDKEKRTITITDNGVGMTKDELENNLGITLFIRTSFKISSSGSTNSYSCSGAATCLLSSLCKSLAVKSTPTVTAS